MCTNEYYLNLHVGGKFVRDPHLRYVNGTKVRIKEDPDTISYFELCKIVQEDLSFNVVQIIYFYVSNSKSLYDGLRVVWDDNNTIDMIYYWYKNFEIDLFVEHKTYTLETIEHGHFLLNEGVSKGIEGAGQSIIEGATQGVGQTAVEGFDKGIEEVDHEIVEEGNEGDGEGNDGDDVYFVKVRYLSDCDDDDELQAGRKKLMRSKEKSIINFDESKNDMERTEKDVQEDAELEEERGKGIVVECGHEIENYDSDDHGHITESFLDDEDEYCARMRGIFSIYNLNDENQEFCIGMLFKDGKDFKDAIRKYSKLSRRELKIVRNESKRIRVKCIASAKCPWRIFVKIFQEEHNFCVSFQNKMVNVSAIADHFEATIRYHPKMKLNEIQRRVASEMHVNVNITRCKRAKKRVNEKLSGNFKEEFAMLWDYVDELRLKNPGSTIKMVVQRVTPDSPPLFKRFFVCFDYLKKGWKQGCRPILGLDGCFLKGPFEGELLSAIGRDANNQMYLVAWAVVELECTDSWAWFLNLLATDLDLNDCFGFTIISDQQKGLEIAIKDILPRVEHRNCARHVFVNWIGRKKVKSYEFDCWEIVKATTEREWEDKIEALTQKDELVAKDLKSKSPKYWTKAFSGCHSKCDMVDNNICEAFNSSILEARYKSIITMLEEIKVKLMTRIVDKRKFCESWKHNYGPLLKKKFDQSKKDDIEWQIVWNGENGCEVKKGRKQYIVNILERICSCRSWQITGLPCPHACCAIWHRSGDPDDYLDQYYHKQTYMKAYAYA
ncbi:hypothetical protein V6N13_071684 [Hibiscus sabdariffa]